MKIMCTRITDSYLGKICYLKISPCDNSRLYLGISNQDLDSKMMTEFSGALYIMHGRIGKTH